MAAVAAAAAAGGAAVCVVVLYEYDAWLEPAPAASPLNYKEGKAPAGWACANSNSAVAAQRSSTAAPTDLKSVT